MFAQTSIERGARANIGGVRGGSLMAVPQIAGARTTGRRRRRSLAGWQFVGPFMAVFTLVFLAPIAYSIYLSLFQNRLIGGNSFVGLDNYQRALRDSSFWAALG